MKTNFIERIMVLGIAAIGAVGEALLLFHWLVDCYPYKMMSYPSDSFYAAIGYAGLVAGPTAAIVVSVLVSRYGAWYVPVVATILCPLVFWTIFVAASSAHRIDDLLAANMNYDHTTHAKVQTEFLQDVYHLIVAGVVVGLISGILGSVVGRLIGHRDWLRRDSV